MQILFDGVQGVKVEAFGSAPVATVFDLGNPLPVAPYGSGDADWWATTPRLGSLIRRWQAARRLEADAAALVPLAPPLEVIEAERHRDRLGRKAARLEAKIARRLVEGGIPALKCRGSLYIGRQADDIDDLGRADAYRLTVVDLAGMVRA